MNVRLPGSLLPPLRAGCGIPCHLCFASKCVLEPAAVIIVALPNVVWWKQRMNYMLGKWRYEDWGIS